MTTEEATPTEDVVTPPAAASPQTETPVVPDDCRTVGAKTECSYAVVGGLKLTADVFKAAGEGLKPAILWIHGGALIMGSRSELSKTQRDRYLAAGYSVVSIDYRLAPETKLDEINKDVDRAYQWLRTVGPNRLAIRSDQIAIVGHSAGGYLTLTSGFRLSPRPKALVSFYGYGEVTADFYTKPNAGYSEEFPKLTKEKAFASVGTTPIAASKEEDQRFNFYVWCRQNGAWPKEVGGHDPATEREWFSEFEALKNITKDYPPTILLHGEQDDDVPFSQSNAMNTALEQAGVPHQLVQRADWGHGFDEEAPKAQVTAAFDKVIAFLDAHVK